MSIDSSIFRFYKGILSLKAIPLSDIKFLSEGAGYFYASTEGEDLQRSGLKSSSVPKFGAVSTRHFIGDGLFICIPLSKDVYLQKGSYSVDKKSGGVSIYQFSHELVIPSNVTFELPNSYTLSDEYYQISWWVTEENVLRSYENTTT